MSKRRLRYILLSVMGIYALAIAAAIALRVSYPQPGSLPYPTFKDLVPFIIAIPAAYLAFAFQRRASYLQAMRFTWTQTVNAVAAAMTYTEITSPDREHYIRTLEKLSAAIEEVRGVFMSAPASKHMGAWYPFKPLQEIRKVISSLGDGETTAEARRDAHHQIWVLWKANRGQMVNEFDRDRPTKYRPHFIPTPDMELGGRIDDGVSGPALRSAGPRERQ